MNTIAATLVAIIFLLISWLHIYWVLGGKWGLEAAMPNTMKEHVMVVSRRLAFKVATLLVAVGLFLFGCLFLIQAELLNAPVDLNYIKYANYAVLGVFSLRAIGDFKYCGLFKKIREGTFAEHDTKYFTPLCIIIALLVSVVILF